jgi:hypothetical protein
MFLFNIFLLSCTKLAPPVAPSEQKVTIDSHPKNKALAECWFENPYDYMFSLNSPNPLVLGQSKIGMFSAATNGLLYYSGAYKCLAQIGGFEVGNPWTYDGHGALAVILDNFDAPPLYLNGSEEELDCGLKNYNPKAISWLHHWIPAPDDIIAGIPAQQIYHGVFSRFIRMMTESHQWLALQNKESEQQQYCDVVDSNTDMLMYLESRYNNVLPNYTVPPNGTDFLPEYAIAFWIRRSLDGTEQAFWQGLQLVVEGFDSTWYAQTQLRE